MKYTTPNGQAYTPYLNALSENHLMIAGTTGSGKSVLLNGLIYTALYQSPNKVQFILIDPKRVELSMYRQLPHTLYYASEPDDRIKALQYAMNLCESRYREMQNRGLKTYDGSHVYVIIDEYADLITTQKRETKPLIQRLCQIGRASRIHVILCTQSPIREILDTTIKCNIDARFALRTRSKQDSINILGRSCCELLPKVGHAYYMSPSEFTHYDNIPYYTDNILLERVEWWTRQTVKPSLLQRLFKIA